MNNIYVENIIKSNKQITDLVIHHHRCKKCLDENYPTFLNMKINEIITENGLGNKFAKYYINKDLLRVTYFNIGEEDKILEISLKKLRRRYKINKIINNNNNEFI